MLPLSAIVLCRLKDGRFSILICLLFPPLLALGSLEPLHGCLKIFLSFRWLLLLLLGGFPMVFLPLLHICSIRDCRVAFLLPLSIISISRIFIVGRKSSMVKASLALTVFGGRRGDDDA